MIENFEVLNLLIRAFWFVFPMGVANCFPVLFGKWIRKWLDFPVDFGKSIGGSRMFGKNKTFAGIGFAVIGGGVAGLVEFYFGGGFGFGVEGDVTFFMMIGSILGLFAILGDLFKSFLKRRMGIAEGGSWLFFDQVDYLIGGMVGAFILNLVGVFEFGELENWDLIVGISLLIGIVLHFVMNVLAFLVRMKQVWW